MFKLVIQINVSNLDRIFLIYIATFRMDSNRTKSIFESIGLANKLRDRYVKSEQILKVLNNETHIHSINKHILHEKTESKFYSAGKW